MTLVFLSLSNKKKKSQLQTGFLNTVSKDPEITGRLVTLATKHLFAPFIFQRENVGSREETRGQSADRQADAQGRQAVRHTYSQDLEHLHPNLCSKFSC